MMCKIKISILFLFVFLGASSCANRAVDVIAKSPNGIEIRKGGVVERLSLEIEVADWLVSCDRHVAVVWGQTKREMSLGEVPYAEIYVVNLENGVALKSFTTTRGPYEVYFKNDAQEAVVDQYLINAHTGRVITTELPLDAVFPKDDCPSFLGKTYGRNRSAP